MTAAPLCPAHPVPRGTTWTPYWGAARVQLACQVHAANIKGPFCGPLMSWRRARRAEHQSWGGSSMRLPVVRLDLFHLSPLAVCVSVCVFMDEWGAHQIATSLNWVITQRSTWASCNWWWYQVFIWLNPLRSVSSYLMSVYNTGGPTPEKWCESSDLQGPVVG